MVIEARDLTKRYGARTAVDHLSFVVEPGVVTGFLGPNGSGKSTTMRLLLGLDRPDSGWATFDGKPYRSYRHPLNEVGALLDAGFVHPTRSGFEHLHALAASNRIRRSRIDEVLALVGMSEVARKRVGTYSLGMKQRLGIAAAMLGNPRTLLFDEPANGLDPEGVRWIREFLRHLAHEGRTVLVSSHQLAEMAQMADHLVVIGQGRLIQQGPVGEFVNRFSRLWVRVQSPQMAALSQLLGSRGASLEFENHTTARVTGLGAAQVGEVAAANGIVLHQLADNSGSLEEAYLQVTQPTVEYRGQR